MATDKEHSTNDEVNRDNEFQKRVDLKETVIDFLKETLVSVTDANGCLSQSNICKFKLVESKKPTPNLLII